VRSAHAPCLKIAGFGMSKSAIEESMPKTRLPSAAVYTPPELLASGYGGYPQYDGAACDAWCLGVCLFCARPDPAALPARAGGASQPHVHVMHCRQKRVRLI